MTLEQPGLDSDLLNRSGLERGAPNTVVGFIQRNILSRFRAPITIISNEGSHFANK